MKVERGEDSTSDGGLAIRLVFGGIQLTLLINYADLEWEESVNARKRSAAAHPQ